MKVVYNYYFSKYGSGYGLTTGGSAVGTLSGGGWDFDGQVFTRSKKHPYNGKIAAKELKIITVWRES